LQFTFNTKIPRAKDVIYALKIVPDEKLSAVCKEPDKKPKITVLVAHELLHYISSKSTIEIAKDLGWVLFDNGNTRESCAIGKGCQKNVFLDVVAVKIRCTSKSYWSVTTNL
jgi:hypothetical protein